MRRKPSSLQASSLGNSFRGFAKLLHVIFCIFQLFLFLHTFADKTKPDPFIETKPPFVAGGMNEQVSI
jgi:hypothetical protein